MSSEQLGVRRALAARAGRGRPSRPLQLVSPGPVASLNHSVTKRCGDPSSPPLQAEAPWIPKSFNRSRSSRSAVEFTKARELQAVGLYPYFNPISESEDTVVVIDGQKRIMLGSNNYLGLTHHPKVLEAASPRAQPLRLGLHRQPVPQRHARPARAARARPGRVPGQGSLPRLLHRLLGQPGPDLRAGRPGRGGLPRQARPRLDRGRRQAVLRRDRALQPRRPRPTSSAGWSGTGRARGSMIVVDGVYSMEGNIADVPALVRIARKYGAALALDDAHALGVLGPNGDGTAAHFGMTDEVDIIAGTFSKSLASIGGFVAAQRERHPLSQAPQPAADLHRVAAAGQHRRRARRARRCCRTSPSAATACGPTPAGCRTASGAWASTSGPPRRRSCRC